MNFTVGIRQLAFGPFVLDRGRMALLRDGKVVAIGQRGFALLWALAETDDTVSRKQLLEAVWPGMEVEEGNLNVQIAGLRKALGPRPDGHEWIITMSRVGYRLVRDAGPSHTTGELTLPGLAVLPFQNLSGGEGERRVVSGIAEGLVNALGRFRDFELETRRTSADGTAARYLLEGGVQAVGRQLRVTMQLVERGTGAHVWADGLDCAADDALAVQDEVTRRVAGGAVDALQLAEIARADKVAVHSAYEFYLQAASKYKILTPRGHAEGFELVNRALRLDPTHARTLSHGAMLLGNNHRTGWPPLSGDDRALCTDFIERAEVSVSDDAQVLGECSDAMLHFTREYRRAVETARRACAINPYSPRALLHLGIASIHCGDLGEAVEAFLRVARSSPQGFLASVSQAGLAHVAMIRGEYEEAIGWAAKALAVTPRFDAIHWMLIAGNAHLGRLDAARYHLEELRRRVPNETVAGIRAGQPDYDRARIDPILDGLQLAGMP
jgi:DNA-binding winged helix-turn-helix (wHTH) protein/tetratricopeptide (TPR) repeat protein